MFNFEDMCTESNLIVKDLIAPLLGFFGTLFIAGMAYNGILVKLQKDTQIKWIDEFRNEIATLITYCREINDLIKSNRFSADKRDAYLDAYLFVVLNWARFVGLDLSRWPQVERYVSSVASRPAVRKAMVDEGLIEKAAA